VSQFSTQHPSRWLARAFGAGLLALVVALIAACGEPSLPAGVYTNQQYHFKVSYPAGWQVNVSQQSDADAPLIVIITRSGAHSVTGSIISSLTIDVLKLSDVGGPQISTQLAQDKTLTPVTLSGLTAYQDKPTQQKGAGNESSFTVTHTDYFIVHGGYEYQMSIDALSGDESTLEAMTHSFTII
jgi:hypothetical protein